MTAPMSTVDPAIVAHVRRMRNAAFNRDAAMDRVLAVRRGEFASVWPDQFSEKYPTAIVANFVDVAARDLAANLSPLPSLACSAGQMHTDADKKRAEKKNRIGFNYWRHSRLQTQMKYGADQYLTFGFLPFWVEADYKNKLPLIHVEDPNGAYYELNRWHETKRYARTWRQGIQELAALFPECANRILYNEHGIEYAPSSDTEVVRFIDDKCVQLYLPERGGMVVAYYEHGQDFCPVHIALRPGVEMNPRGQFDDVLWVQLAHTVMAALTLEAGHKAVQAPIIAPSDVQEIPIGPDAVMITDSPEKIGRLALTVPEAAFALGQQLHQEMQEGAGYPDTRFGNGPVGGSTGRGVSALEGGFDTQIKLGQDILGDALRIITEMAFKMDRALWPRFIKTITGTLSGETFQLSYQPDKDIADTACEVTYGFASGTSPNAAIVTLLQLQGGEIIGRDTFRRQLPFDIDIEQQQRELDIQSIEDGMRQGINASLQSIGQMMAQGQSAEALQMLTAAASIIKGRRSGKPLDELFLEAFQPPPAPPQQPGAPGEPGAEPGAPGAVGPDGQPLAGVSPNGLPAGVAPGQAGLPPGGRPSILDLTAGFTGSGKAAVGAGVRQRIATGV